jgi:hypothetical protein
VSLLMADASKQKSQDISNDGDRIYVPQDSFVWDQYQDDEALSGTLRLADNFLQDIVEFTRVEANV